MCSALVHTLLHAATVVGAVADVLAVIGDAAADVVYVDSVLLSADKRSGDGHSTVCVWPQRPIQAHSALCAWPGHRSCQAHSALGAWPEPCSRQAHSAVCAWSNRRSGTAHSALCAWRDRRCGQVRSVVRAWPVCAMCAVCGIRSMCAWFRRATCVCKRASGL